MYWKFKGAFGHDLGEKFSDFFFSVRKKIVCTRFCLFSILIKNSKYLINFAAKMLYCPCPSQQFMSANFTQTLETHVIVYLKRERRKTQHRSSSVPDAAHVPEQPAMHRPRMGFIKLSQTTSFIALFQPKTIIGSYEEKPKSSASVHQLHRKSYNQTTVIVLQSQHQNWSSP